MRYACVAIPHFPIQVELRRKPKLRGRPVVLIHSSGSQRMVFDTSPRASAVAPGMSVQEALARCSAAVLLEADLSTYRQCFERILDNLGNVSPTVEDGGPGLAYVDLRGLVPMYGDEARVTKALLEAVPLGFYPLVGIADGKFSSYVATSYAHYGGAYQAPGDMRNFLAPLLVETLPVSSKVIARLHSFGIQRLGQVAALGVGPLQAQFGSTGHFMWKLALGIDYCPLVPRRTEQIVREEIDFPVPTVSLGAILLALEHLLVRAFSRPILRGRYARAALLQGEVPQGSLWLKRVNFREAVGSKSKAYEVLKGILSTETLPGPLGSVSLTLSGFTGEAGHQGSFFRDVRQRQQLREMMAQLEVRLGQRPPVFMVREVEPWSRIPERQRALVPYAP